MRRFARLFINQELHDQLSFGDVRKKAFETIIPEEELRHKIPEENEEELKPIDFQWKLVDTLFHRCQLQLRPLMMAIDFSSTADESPWLKAITWLKELFGANKTINQYPVTANPEKPGKNAWKNTCLMRMPRVRKNSMPIAMNFGFIVN